MMSGEAWLYLFAVIINAVNLFLQVFFTIMYSDLEWYVHHRHNSRDARYQDPTIWSCPAPFCLVSALPCSKYSRTRGWTNTSATRWRILLICWQRLHQPNRSLQPSKHIHYPRSGRPWFADLSLSHQWLLGGLVAQPTIISFQRQEVCPRVKK